MTNTTAMREHIRMLGLEIMSSLSPLQRNSTNQWSPLLGGGWYGQTCVTIVSGNGAHPHENDAAAQAVVVLGGGMQSQWSTNSVMVWNPSTMEWKDRPNLNGNRRGLVAVVCHDQVYAIGRHDEHAQALDTMESIQVSSLLETMETSTTRQNTSQWTRLQCQLSS